MDQIQNLQTWMTTFSEPTETILLYVVAAILFPFAYGVIFDKAVIRSGFQLIAVFGGISALFMILQAQFLAMAQIMIYAVGITLVVVIALMLTNPKMEKEEGTGIPANQYLGFITALFVFMTIYMSLFGESFPITTEVPGRPNLQLIGSALTTTYALPFEFASILLLAAVVGAVMLAKSDSSIPDDDEYEEEEPASESFTIKKDSQGNEPASVSR